MSKYDLIRATIRVLEVAEQERQNPPMALSSKEKQADYRKRMAEAGLSEVRNIFLPKALHPALKAYAEKLAKKKPPLKE